MKRIIASMFVFLFIFVSSIFSFNGNLPSYSPEAAGEMMFAPHGDHTPVWQDNSRNSIVKVYSPYGVENIIFRSRLEEYKNAGWSENYEDIVKKIYAPDGREATIFSGELETYKNLGWFDDKRDVTRVVCAPDGRKERVFLTEVESYLSSGWSYAQSDKIDPSKPMIALTFDDGPGFGVTTRILDVFEKYNARATFYIVGCMIGNQQDTLKRTVRIGCQLGNHTYTHPYLAEISAEEIESELKSAQKAIAEASGVDPTTIRPPYGSVNQQVVDIAEKPLVHWSLDTLDWQNRNAEHVSSKILNFIKDGDIVLMHDVYDTTAEAVEIVVPELIKRGFQLVTVDELAAYKGHELYAHNKYFSFK